MDGICSLQININGPAGEKDAVWIGQFEVGKVSFAESISWEPVKNIYNQGDTITLISKNEVKDSTHEFQLQVLNASDNAGWVVELPWQSSLPEYTFKEKGILALQIDICKSSDKNNFQSIWLGQFTVG